MGKPYDERRKSLNLAVHKLRVDGWSNREIAERIGVRVEQVPGMVRTGSRIVQTTPTGAEAGPELKKGGLNDKPPEGDA